MDFFVVPTAKWTAQQLVEAFRLSLRREMLDLVIVLDGRHLTRLLKTYVVYYNRWRTHRSLEGDAPDTRPVRPAAPERTVEISAVHGLHHYYLPEAA